MNGHAPVEPDAAARAGAPLAEAIYRAWSLQKGHPYHRE